MLQKKLTIITVWIPINIWEFFDEFDIVFLNKSLMLMNPTEKAVNCTSFV